jgi:dolichol-phosphate mannosyltransferase
MTPLISIIIPLFNEAENIDPLLAALREAISPLEERYAFEIIFVNDGSHDESGSLVEHRAHDDDRVRLVDFSRNFGKEAATSAGLRESKGDAVILIDADLQHPPELIPEFIQKWEEGNEVVVGVRNHSKSDGIIRKLGSHAYYSIIKVIGETDITPRATDFRLLDRMVVDEFNTLTEHNRMTRGLVDWLGFKREYIYFDANERVNGVASYRISQLVKLAVASFIAHSFAPLRVVGYLGVLIVLFSGVLGVVEFLDRFIFTWRLNFSGTALLATVTLFLVGIVLSALGLLAFYVEHIFKNAQGRPLYVVRRRK